MRFKAKLAPDQVSLLHSLIVPMTRLGGGDGGAASTGTGGFSWKNTTQNNALARNGTILYLDSDFMRFSCQGRTSDTDGMTCFAELAADGMSSNNTSHSIFMDRRIESVAPNNAIVMELDLAQLRLALKSVLSNNNSSSSSTHQATTDAAVSVAAAQSYAVLKLAKRQGVPCLCLDACNTSRHGSSSAATAAWIQVHHAIPVRILRHTEMSHYMPPQIRLPDVQLELTNHNHHHRPAAANLRVIVDRLKQMNRPTLYLQANMRGELTVSSHADGASIETYFGNLKPRYEHCHGERDGSDDDVGNAPVPLSSTLGANEHDNDATGSTATPSLRPSVTATTRVKVDTKKLAASLQWQQQQQHSTTSAPPSVTQSGSTVGHTGMVSSALLCLVANEMLVVHVNLYPEQVGFFTYYVPVHFVSPDDPYEE